MRTITSILAGVGAGLIIWFIFSQIVLKANESNWRCIKYSPVNGECILKERINEIQ
jgi:hypothetical protein